MLLLILLFEKELARTLGISKLARFCRFGYLNVPGTVGVAEVTVAAAVAALVGKFVKLATGFAKFGLKSGAAKFGIGYNNWPFENVDGEVKSKMGAA